jgi:hypothetical protein
VQGVEDVIYADFAKPTRSRMLSWRLIEVAVMRPELPAPIATTKLRVIASPTFPAVQTSVEPTVNVSVPSSLTSRWMCWTKELLGIIQRRVSGLKHAPSRARTSVRQRSTCPP